MMATAVKGKTVLITGASSGIGLEAAVDLARLGAAVVLVAREGNKSAHALAEVQTRSKSTAVSLMTCDLSSLAEVRRLAGGVRARHARIDVLVNNAGTVSPERRLTIDGLEQTFAVNHLSHFVLTNLLLDRLEAGAPSRIVHVSSAANRSGGMDFGNLQFERGGYSLLKAYSRSKLANVMFSNELARRLAGRRVTSNCLHPGAVATNIWSHTSWYVRPVVSVLKMFMLSPARGAEHITYLASSPDVEGETGGYYENNRRVPPSPLGLDQALAGRLWEVSMQLAQPFLQAR
jgi:NAD(P)-dependent dehydrogenase (short-subunit alcohol dehydrogenase family)